MSSDDEDFVFYGTPPIEREEDVTTRKKKALAVASGQLRTALPPWKQEYTPSWVLPDYSRPSQNSKGNALLLQV
ncbi:hypothetical protein CASFOL_042545 [Castilleja foliolosa]|uniref:Uncharacterized protein n=1 Tax=Castilleja foliolosa TaxID=1961234 RepID=A0ABD3B8C7_9LAMI